MSYVPPQLSLVAETKFSSQTVREYNLYIDIIWVVLLNFSTHSKSPVFSYFSQFNC